MQSKDLKKERRQFCKTDLNVRNTKEREPEEKVIALNSGEKKWRNNNNKFFKSECNKCGKYGHRASECWGNKNENRNDNKTERNPFLNRECNNCGKRGHRDSDCWAKKVKEKDDDIENLFLGTTVYGEFQEYNDKEDPE